jgi:hypothetical protein
MVRCALVLSSGMAASSQQLQLKLGAPVKEYALQILEGIVRTSEHNIDEQGVSHVVSICRGWAETELKKSCWSLWFGNT